MDLNSIDHLAEIRVTKTKLISSPRNCSQAFLPTCVAAVIWLYVMFISQCDILYFQFRLSGVKSEHVR